MSPDEKQEMVNLIVAGVRATNGDQHDEEHLWLRERIEKEKQRAEFYRKTGQAVFGTVIASALVWIGSHAIDFVKFIVDGHQ